MDYTSGNISPMDARPYPVYGIISPLYAQIVFIIIAMLGLGLQYGLGLVQVGRNHNIL